MTPFDKLIEKIKHRKWRVTNQGNIRDMDCNCPLDALVHEIVLNHYYGSCSNAYAKIGGSQRQAWVIMSAADNRVVDPFTDPEFSKIKPSEVKAMRDRLIGALNPKLDSI